MSSNPVRRTEVAASVSCQLDISTWRGKDLDGRVVWLAHDRLSGLWARDYGGEYIDVGRTTIVRPTARSAFYVVRDGATSDFGLTAMSVLHTHNAWDYRHGCRRGGFPRGDATGATRALVDFLIEKEC